MYSNSVIIKRIIRLLKPWKKLIIVSNILTVFSSVLSVFSIVAAFPLLEIIFSTKGSDISKERITKEATVQDHSIEKSPENITWIKEQKESIDLFFREIKDDIYTLIYEDPIQGIYTIILIILLATIARSVLLLIVNSIISKIETDFIQTLTYRLYHHIITHDRIFFSKFPLGKLISRISIDIFKLRSLIELVYVSKIQYPIQIAALFITLFFVSFKLALFSLIFFPLIVIPAVYLSKQVKKLSQKEVGFDASFVDLIEEQFGGQHIIKAMNSEENETHRFEFIAEDNFKRRKKRFFIISMSQPIQDLFVSISIALLILFGVYIVFEEKIIEGEVFLYFLVLIAYLYASIKKLLDLNVLIQRPLMSAGAIFKTLDEEQILNKQERTIAFPNEWKEMKVSQVSFRYSKKRGDVFKDLNVSIARGETLLLYGRNGSGKSTLASLLAGFYQCRKGSITIDNVSILDINQKEYRMKVGYIHQDSIIFNFSIAENIAFGIPEEQIDYLKIDKIIEELSMHDFINSLDNGVRSVCGSKGSNLSGGQRQMLAFCRALYFDYTILIIDEPTAGLDYVMETKVMETLLKLKEEKTIILISHNKRFQSIADRKLSIGIEEISQ